MIKIREIRMKKIFSLLLLQLLFFVSLVHADNAQLTSKLQQLLDDAIADSKTPGAVLLVSSPKIGTIAVASGYADKEEETPMHVDNNFRLASMSKTFLAVAALKFVDQKKLNLDDKMADLLPENIEASKLP